MCTISVYFLGIARYRVALDMVRRSPPNATTCSNRVLCVCTLRYDHLSDGVPFGRVNQGLAEAVWVYPHGESSG